MGIVDEDCNPSQHSKTHGPKYVQQRVWMTFAKANVMPTRPSDESEVRVTRLEASIHIGETTK